MQKPQTPFCLPRQLNCVRLACFCGAKSSADDLERRLMDLLVETGQPLGCFWPPQPIGGLPRLRGGGQKYLNDDARGRCFMGVGGGTPQKTQVKWEVNVCLRWVIWKEYRVR